MKTDRHVKTMKYKIEAIDRYNKSITQKVIGGDFYISIVHLRSYHHVNNNGLHVHFEYENKIEENP